MEEHVTYEQSVKLKELGFNWKCNYYYNSNELIENTEKCFTSYDDFNNNDYIDTCYSAPTLTQAQKWLREVKQLCICSINKIDYRGRYKYQWILTFLNEDKSIGEDEIFFDTYEEALIAGIDTALKLLIEK